VRDRKSLRVGVGILRLGLPTLLMAASAAAAGTYEILHDFDVIALRQEYGYAENPAILKWEEPIHYRVARHAEVDDAEVEFLESYLQTLAGITRLPFTPVSRMSEANFRILFVNQKDVPEIARRTFTGDRRIIDYVIERANCLTLYGSNKRGALDSVTVLIPVDGKDRGQLRRCVLEETTQAMGLINDAPDVGVSLFNSRGGRVERLNTHDRTLLELLYDPRIKAGMPREEALRIVREILTAQDRTPSGPDETGRYPAPHESRLQPAD
jgi:hypothetical protein